MLSEPLHDRDAEGERLAGPGLGLAGDVPSVERIGNGERLDGKGRVDLVLGQSFSDVVGDAEVEEGLGRGEF